MHRTKSIPILLIAVIATAQLLCSCQSVLATMLVRAKPAAHACCESDPAPATPAAPVDHLCPHCNGTATAGMIDRTATPPAALDFACLPIASPALVGLFILACNHSPCPGPFTSPPAPTLLELHCALNC